MNSEATIDKEEFERRLRKLALREGLTFATFAAFEGIDRAVLRTTLVQRFQMDRVYSEREVNALLQTWLRGAGSMVETDHVTLRRWLVDSMVLNRTSDCARYRLAQAPTAVPDAESAPIDADAIVLDARRAALEQRAARKAAWQRRANSLDGTCSSGTGSAGRR